MHYAKMIRERLSQVYPNALIEVHDPDGVHLSLKIEDESFQGMTKMQQHRAIYQALGDIFEQGLHALEIQSSGKWGE